MKANTGESVYHLKRRIFETENIDPQRQRVFFCGHLLIDRDRLLLFAGAGIVCGSQAEEEWAEIENKIRHFTDLFTNASIEVT